MATNFPGSVDSFPRPTEFDDTDDTGLELDLLVDNLSDAVEALEQKAILTEASWAVSATPTASFVQASSRPSTTVTLSLNRLVLAPMNLLSRTYTALGFMVAVGEAGILVRLGIYERLPSGSPGALLLDAGAVTTAAGGNTAYYQTISFAPTKPEVYFGIVFQSAITTFTVRGVNNNSAYANNGLVLPASGEAQGTMYTDSVSGALPASATWSVAHISTPSVVIR